MNVNIFTCTDCGRSYMPVRLRCHACGGRTFESQPVPQARVDGLTRVHRVPADCEYEYLVQLTTPSGVHIVAGSAHALTVGQSVLLAQRMDGAIFVTQP